MGDEIERAQPDGNDRQDDQNRLADALRKVLDSHGYGFQYAVLEDCRRNGWHESVHEYPVDLKSASVHIDFILSRQGHLLVAECKRVEGWAWGFARSGSRRGSWDSQPRADYLVHSNNHYPDPVRRTILSFSAPGGKPYDVAVELKHAALPANNGGASPKALDQSVSQVLRARGGLIDEMSRSGQPLSPGAVVPVIFTNAPLIVTQTELATADLAKGKLGTVDAIEVNFLWYDYRLPSALRPNTALIEKALDGSTKITKLRQMLDREVLRSIAVVRPAGIEDFLQRLPDCLTHGSDPIP